MDRDALELLTGDALDDHALLFYDIRRNWTETDESLRSRVRSSWAAVAEFTVGDTVHGTFNNATVEPLTLDKVQAAVDAVNAQIEKALIIGIDPAAKTMTIGADDDALRERLSKRITDRAADAWDWAAGLGSVAITSVYVKPKRQAFEADSADAVEHVMPAPYRGTLDGVRTELAQFRFEVVGDPVWYRPHADSWNQRKTLTINTRQRPRGDEGGGVRHDPDGTPYVLISFSATYEVSRPDALCLRELVMLAMRHELEESILVDGVRVWDPHVGRPFGI